MELVLNCTTAVQWRIEQSVGVVIVLSLCRFRDSEHHEDRCSLLVKLLCTMWLYGERNQPAAGIENYLTRNFPSEPYLEAISRASVVRYVRLKYKILQDWSKVVNPRVQGTQQSGTLAMDSSNYY